MLRGLGSRVEVGGVAVPRLLYGTAWKEDRTEALVAAALRAGFRGIDTANQRRHYHEAGVGAAVQASGIPREDLFLQTKFTYVRGQDHRLPYDPRAPIGEQVAQSFESSLAHFGVETIDSYLLHGPWGPRGLAEEDRDAWRAMEALQKEGRVRLIGISNVQIDQLRELHDWANVKPAVVQNRTFAMSAADLAVRAFCRERGLAYEGFSLLTAIPQALTHPSVTVIAERAGRTPAEVLFRFYLAQGMVVLTGTTSEEHMAQDLSVAGFELPDEDLAGLRALLGGADLWL